MKYQCVLFDLDGTLLDSKMGFWRSFEYALKKLGYPEPQIDVIEPYIGPPIELVLKNDFGFTLEEGKQGRLYYLEEYEQHGVMFKDPFFPGTAEAVARLQEAGCLVGVCTNKGQGCASPLVKRGKIGISDDKVVGYDPDPRSGCHDKVQIIATFLDRFGYITPDQKKKVLMVGDRNTDIQGADAVGIDGAGVTWGNGSRKELEATDAVMVADTYDDLLSWIGV